MGVKRKRVAKLSDVTSGISSPAEFLVSFANVYIVPIQSVRFLSDDAESLTLSDLDFDLESLQRFKLYYLARLQNDVLFSALFVRMCVRAVIKNY